MKGGRGAFAIRVGIRGNTRGSSAPRATDLIKSLFHEIHLRGPAPPPSPAWAEDASQPLTAIAILTSPNQGVRPDRATRLCRRASS
jgi:hypothetical protein